MSSATLTLLGLYQYGIRHGINLFDSLTVPAAIDKETLVNNILHRCSDFEVLYPDFEFMLKATKMFSTKWQRTFEKWVDLLNAEYEPLDNYDRKEAWSDSESTSTSEKSSTSASDSTSDSTLTSNNISAFNSDTMRPDTSASVDALTAGLSKVESNHTDVSKRLYEHRGRVHGNIGVKTTQSIWMEEAQLQKDFNIYDEIMILYAREFLIPFEY